MGVPGLLFPPLVVVFNLFHLLNFMTKIKLVGAARDNSPKDPSIFKVMSNNRSIKWNQYFF